MGLLCRAAHVSMGIVMAWGDDCNGIIVGGWMGSVCTVYVGLGDGGAGDGDDDDDGD